MPKYLTILSSDDQDTLNQPSCFKLVLFYAKIETNLLLKRTVPQIQYVAARYVVRYPQVKFYMINRHVTAPEKMTTLVESSLSSGSSQLFIQFVFWSTIRAISYGGSLKSANFVEELCEFLESIMDNIRAVIATNDALLRAVDAPDTEMVEKSHKT